MVSIGPVLSGSPASFLLTGSTKRLPGTVVIARELIRRGVTPLRAKRAIDELAETGQVYVEVPVVEDVATFQRLVAEQDAKATHLDTAAPVDARGIRESLGLTQEQFALRFGLELDTLRNWETGRREPDTAAKSYLRVIAREPARVQIALAGG